MMMKMMAKTGSMKIRVFKGQFCENVLQILDRTPPKPNHNGNLPAGDWKYRDRTPVILQELHFYH